MGAGKSDSVTAKQKVAKCVVVGVITWCNVGEEHTDMMVECFQWIKTEHIRRVIVKRHLGSAETVVI